ncbi:MAG: sulfate reduction electron transfer complex DsrMKJOP subunit DsrJ [Desulfuromonadales bacterium]|nr:sulfate reduction electron transfer complex DsrMKJOP subunit DsrJ [Desulfuromonadales bacterium]
MRDRVLIFAGLSLFLALVTYPVWQGLAARSSTAGPVLPATAAGQKCVAPRDVMRVAHMEMLMSWRDLKVRENQRTYTAADGTVYTIDLTATCLTQCHGPKEKFCDSCHAYAGVPAVNCWSCHTSPPAAPNPGELR